MGVYAEAGVCNLDVAGTQGDIATKDGRPEGWSHEKKLSFMGLLVFPCQLVVVSE